jgi:hypothetical protein
LSRPPIPGGQGIPPQVLQLLQQMQSQQASNAPPTRFTPPVGGANWGPRPPWNPTPAGPTGYPPTNPPPISTG